MRVSTSFPARQWMIVLLTLLSGLPASAALPRRFIKEVIEPIKKATHEAKRDLKMRIAGASSQETPELIAALSRVEELEKKEIHRLETLYEEGIKKSPFTHEFARSRALALARESIVEIKAMEEGSSLDPQVRAHAARFVEIYEEVLLLPYLTEGTHPASKNRYLQSLSDHSAKVTIYGVGGFLGTIVIEIIWRGGGRAIDRDALLVAAVGSGVLGTLAAIGTTAYYAVTQWPKSQDTAAIYWRELGQYLLIHPDSKTWPEHLSRLRCSAILEGAAPKLLQ